MIVLEYKLKGNQYQCQAIDGAIRAAQYLVSLTLLGSIGVSLSSNGESVNQESSSSTYR